MKVGKKSRKKTLTAKDSLIMFVLICIFCYDLSTVEKINYSTFTINLGYEIDEDFGLNVLYSKL